MSVAKPWIEQLALEPHPEGGFYKEHYRAPLVLDHAALPQRFGGPRAVCTSIYYLLEQGDFSAFHRIRSDELWHFYDGDALDVFIITSSGELEVLRLGRGAEENLCGVVPAGRWFASRPATDSVFSLVGCTVAPGFDFSDFEMGRRDALIETYPALTEIIESLTRK